MVSFSCTLVLFLALITKCLAGVNLSKKISEPASVLNTLVDAPDFIGLAAENGYKAETHKVTTEDGYILTMHRIPPREGCDRKKPVLLLHGLLQSSEDMISAGPFAPGYVVADNCYDAWFGNVRGNFNSRRHVRLNPDTDLEFWKFSYDQMGLYDIPAMVDYVLYVTNSTKLIYVGFSQGGLTYFIMNSERPEYTKKISLFVCLAPATRLRHMKSLVAKTVFEVSEAFVAPLEASGIWEVAGRGFLAQSVSSFLCQNKLLAATFCVAVTSSIDSLHPESITPEIEQRIKKYFPSGTSVTNLKHFGQSSKTEKFVKFDHGPVKNMEIYGSSEPPAYNFKASNVPTVVVRGLSDNLVDLEDLGWAVPQLPNVLEYIQVADPLWNHFDMVYSRFWNATIFSRMKPYFIKYDEYDDAE